MYRRGFSVNTLRYRAQNWLRQGRRMRNPGGWAAGVGCVLIAACLVCVGVVALGVYLYTTRAATSALGVWFGV